MTAQKTIAFEAILAVLGRGDTASMTVGEIAAALNVSRQDRPRLRRLLAHMVDNGLLDRVRRGHYALRAAPESASAARSAPAQSAPAQPAPRQPTPAQPTPRQSTPTQPTSATPRQPTPTQPTSATPRQPTPEQPTPEQPTPEQPTPEQPTPEQPTPEQPAPERASARSAAVRSVSDRQQTRSRYRAQLSEAVHKGEPNTETRDDEDRANRGRIAVHPAGYGFVELEDGTEAVFIPARNRGLALDGDRVLLDTWPSDKGTEGRVIQVLQRGRSKLTGILQRSGKRVYLAPDDPRIATDYARVPLLDGDGRGAIGAAAVAEICCYPTASTPRLVGRLLRVLGEPNDPRTEIEKILVCADIPMEFPAAVQAQADDIPPEVQTRDLVDRIDLRDRPFLTIDPENARDFDDALCVETAPRGGPRVWIAVADVSHYVHADQPIDIEAASRGVSVYLPDRVIPMLPLPLSADICSLKSEVDRCAMVVRLDLSWDGAIIGTDIAAAVIRSQARLDYPGVAAALRGDFRGRRAGYRQWAQPLRQLHQLAQALRRRRMDRGALELTLPEAKVVLDADDPRLVRDVVRAKGSEEVRQAYQLVEEFMIAANEAVGAFLAERNAPAVWRVHAPPEATRIQELAQVLNSFGVPVDEDMIAAATTPRGLKSIVAAIGDRPAARALSFLVLRSLKQAFYDTRPIGHFGLASQCYLHFTSPIRRYADLLVHRLLKYHLHREGKASGGGQQRSPVDPEQLQELAALTSERERRALEAEREAVAMYRAHLMRDRMGDHLAGRISGVTNFGAFVEAEEPFVEGMIRLDALGDDSFGFDAVGMRLRGRRSGFNLRLGDSVLTEITDVSVARRRIDLRLLSVRGHKIPESHSWKQQRPNIRERRSTARRSRRSYPRRG